MKGNVRVESEAHHQLKSGEYWRDLPAFESVSAQEFETHLFQQRQRVL
jgi:hypothetical protein